MYSVVCCKIESNKHNHYYMFEHLSIEAVNSILPQGMRIINEKGIYNMYQTENGGLIAGTESKNVSRTRKHPFEVYYSLYLDEYVLKNISFVFLTVYKEGILLIPIRDLVSIKENLRTKEYSVGKGIDKQIFLRYDIKAYIEKGKIMLCKAKNHFEIDLSKYFISYTNEEFIYEELNNYDINEIYKEAKQFKDYETQYVLGDNTRRRIESKKQKERIAILENHTCQICGFQQAYINPNGNKRYIIEIDHIIEKSKGGGECIDNLLVLCPNCHAKKTYGIITIDSDFKVYENGKEIQIRDNHLRKK